MKGDFYLLGQSVYQGDLVFVEHKNKYFQGWYIKARDNTDKICYCSITANTPRKYTRGALEYQQEAKLRVGTITKVVQGAENIAKFISSGFKQHNFVIILHDPIRDLLQKQVKDAKAIYDNAKKSLDDYESN